MASSGETHPRDNGELEDSRPPKKAKAADGSVGAAEDNYAEHTRKVLEECKTYLTDVKDKSSFEEIADVLTTAQDCVDDRERLHLHYHSFPRWDAAHSVLCDVFARNDNVNLVLLFCVGGCLSAPHCRVGATIRLIGSVKSGVHFAPEGRSGLRQTAALAGFTNRQTDLVAGKVVAVGNAFHSSEEAIPPLAFDAVAGAYPTRLCAMWHNCDEYCKTKALFHCVLHAARAVGRSQSTFFAATCDRSNLMNFVIEYILDPAHQVLELGAFLLGGIDRGADPELTGARRSVLGVTLQCSVRLPGVIGAISRGTGYTVNNYLSSVLDGLGSRILPGLRLRGRAFLAALKYLHELQLQFQRDWMGLVLVYLGASFLVGMDVMLKEATELFDQALDPLDTSWHAPFAKSVGQHLVDPKIPGSLDPRDPLLVAVPEPPLTATVAVSVSA